MNFYCLTKAFFNNLQLEIAKFSIEIGLPEEPDNTMWDTALHLAIEDRNIELIPFFLNYEYFLNKKNKSGFTPLLLAASKSLGLYEPDDIFVLIYRKKKDLYGTDIGKNEQLSTLHLACIANDVELIDHLLQSGISIDETIPETCPCWPGYTCLHLAADFQRYEVARILLEHGADVTIEDVRGLTAIFVAEKHWILDLTNRMLRAQKSYYDNPVNRTQGLTHFHLACINALEDVVKVFIGHGVDVNIQVPIGIGSRGDTPLHLAYKNLSIVKILLDHGANVSIMNKNGQTPLHCAIEDGSEDVIDVMLAAQVTNEHCHSNPANNDGLSHFHIACMRQSWEIVAAFIERGVDLNAQTNGFTRHWSHYSPLHFAVLLSNVEVVEVLLRHGASVYTEDSYGCTPLHLAAMDDDRLLLAVSLVEGGADVNSQTMDDFLTPLHVAAKYGCFRMAKMLLSKGARLDLRATFWEFTPMHVACKELQHNIVRLLLLHGDNPNVKDRVGRTPMHLCTDTHRTPSGDDCYGRLTSFLLKAGADIEARDHSGSTPLLRACNNENEHAMRALLVYGADVDAGINGSGITSTQICLAKDSYVNFLLEYVERLRLMGLRKFTREDDPVNKAVRNHAGGGFSNDIVQHIQDKCRDEYRRLSKLKVDNVTPAIDLVFNDAVTLARSFLYRKQRMDVILSRRFNKRFPIFRYIMKRMFEDSLISSSFLDQALEIAGLCWNLPVECALFIFKYITNNELKPFLKAYSH